MPIIKSAQKRARQTVVRRQRNLITKTNIKEAKKALTSAVALKDKKKTTAALRALQGTIDTAVKKNLIHKNRAARQMSAAAKIAAPFLDNTAKSAKKAAPKKTATKKAAVKKPVAKKTVAKKPAAKKAAPKKTAKKTTKK